MLKKKLVLNAFIIMNIYVRKIGDSIKNKQVSCANEICIIGAKYVTDVNMCTSPTCKCVYYVTYADCIM